MSAPQARALRRALDGLAAEIAGEPGADPAMIDDGAGDGRVGSSEEISRSQLLRGAALLTGRGDEAQDCVHLAAARTRLGEDGPSGRVGLCGEVLRAVRSRPLDG